MWKFNAYSLLRKGGNWLGVARNKLKCRARGGEWLTWGSSEEVSGLTVYDIETMAAEVASSTLREFNAVWAIQEYTAEGKIEFERFKERYGVNFDASDPRFKLNESIYCRTSDCVKERMRQRIEATVVSPGYEEVEKFFSFSDSKWVYYLGHRTYVCCFRKLGEFE